MQPTALLRAFQSLTVLSQFTVEKMQTHPLYAPYLELSFPTEAVEVLGKRDDFPVFFIILRWLCV